MDPVDLDRLERVRRFAAVPLPSRDDEWVREFEAAFWVAPLGTSEPVEFDTPSGHPFLRVSSRDRRVGDGFVRPAMLVDRLIESGRGLCLVDEHEVGMVWMALGEVVSYRLYGRAFAKDPNPLPPSFQLPAGSSIGLTPVHEGVFPHWARLNVRRHLQRTLGIAAPRAVWTILPDRHAGLTFDLEAERIGDAARVKAAFDRLRWLLPARIPSFRLDPLASATEMRPF